MDTPALDTAPPHLWCRLVAPLQTRPAAACPGSHSSPCSPRHISGSPQALRGLSREGKASRDQEPASGLKPRAPQPQSIRSRSSSCASGGRGLLAPPGLPRRANAGQQAGQGLPFRHFAIEGGQHPESAPGCLRPGRRETARWPSGKIQRSGHPLRISQSTTKEFARATQSSGSRMSS